MEQYSVNDNENIEVTSKGERATIVYDSCNLPLVLNKFSACYLRI